MHFAISDGGVILTEDNKNGYEKKKSLLTLNPYNSSLYKMAVISRTPIVFIEKATDRTIIPIYIHSYETDFDTEEEDAVVSDDEDMTTTRLADKFTLDNSKLISWVPWHP